MIQKYAIQEFLPHINHDNPYDEVFCGSAIVYFNIPYSIHAILNDINDDLMNFWRVIANPGSYAEFQKNLEYCWIAKDNRQWFSEDQLEDPIIQAVVFYLENALNQFITKPTLVKKNLDMWAHKLNTDRVFIDNRDWSENMKYMSKLYTQNKEERPCRVIFYEDPPYPGSEYMYSKSWRKGQKKKRKDEAFPHEELAKKNHELAEAGHFILLSYPKCEIVDSLYSDWYQQEFIYSPNGKGANRSTERTELLLSNEPLIRNRQNTKLDTFFQ
jgi:site-specific DNA-adenine methylase